MKRTMAVRLGSFSIVDLVTLSAECITNGMKVVTFHTPICSITVSTLKAKRYHSKVVRQDETIFSYNDDLYGDDAILEVGYSRRTSRDVLKLEIIHALLSWGLKKIFKDFTDKEIFLLMSELVPRYFPAINGIGKIADDLNFIKYGSSGNRRVSSDLILIYTKLNTFEQVSKKTKSDLESNINKMLDKLKNKHSDRSTDISSMSLKYSNIINGHSFADMVTTMILVMLMRMCTFDENGKILIGKTWINFEFAEKFCGSEIRKTIFNDEE